MRTLLSFALVGIALLSGCSTTPSGGASSESPAAAVVKPIAELAPFAPLVGGTWVAAFNPEVRDEQRYEWVYGGKFLRNEHWVKTKDDKVAYEGETIYAFDPRAKTLVWWYWNATGGYIVGTGKWDGATAEFVGENYAGPDQTERVRSRLELGAADFTATGWFWKDGAWVEQGKRTYRRVK